MDAGEFVCIFSLLFLSNTKIPIDDESDRFSCRYFSVLCTMSEVSVIRKIKHVPKIYDLILLYKHTHAHPYTQL